MASSAVLQTVCKHHPPPALAAESGFPDGAPPDAVTAAEAGASVAFTRTGTEPERHGADDAGQSGMQLPPK